MMNIESLALLPYSAESVLIDQRSKVKVLRLLSFLIEKLLFSYRMFFFEKKYLHFDSHVGDTLCQIRAFKTLLLIAENDESPVEDTYSRILSYGDKISQVVTLFEQTISNKNGKYNERLDKPEKVGDFLANYDLSFCVSTFDYYLLQNQILSEYSIRDEFLISYKVDYHKLGSDLQVGTYTVQKVIRHFQENLATISCDFMAALAEARPEISHLNKLFPYLKLQDRHRRTVLPCYEVTKLILADIARYEYPIGILVYRFTQDFADKHYLIFKHNGASFVLASAEEQRLLNDRPCLFVKGITVYDSEQLPPIDELVKRLLAIGIGKIILANMAIHPQYSPGEFNSLSENPYKALLTGTVRQELEEHDLLTMAVENERELANMQVWAKETGCSMCNPSLFLVKHIFCDIIANQLP